MSYIRRYVWYHIGVAMLVHDLTNGIQIQKKFNIYNIAEI